MSGTLALIGASLYDPQDKSAAELAREALEGGVPALDIVDALSAGITELGKRFEDMELFLPDLMMGGKAMQEAMEVLTPALEAQAGGEAAQKKVKIVVGNLEGDIHDIGRDILATMLRVGGIDVLNIGNNVKADTFIDKAEEMGADAIGLSSLLTTSLPYARDVVGLLEARGLTGKYKVVVGGGAVTKEFADSIGALYGSTAVSAVDVIKEACL
ncbi:MAG: cobalamin-dependent protein [Clostridiales Family XIII bacterium]|jgi:methanogenic corrinoid protein MtbC1|nr:cobalamin-dependent protein [Clostridiales Family XIII bacterium]